MILDFLYRKVDCYYCKKTIRRKDSVELKLLADGEFKEKHIICRRCATLIKYLQEGGRIVKELDYLCSFPMPKWAIKQIVRYDRNRLVEDICEHGVGHPNAAWLKKHGALGDNVHGCDGCCFKDNIEKLTGIPAGITVKKPIKKPVEKKKKFSDEEKKTREFSNK